MSDNPRPPEPQPPPRLLHARDLFRDQREVWIEHAGIRYQLRITRRNKLLLVKPPQEPPQDS
jgi:hemin uptake protein HemP